MSLVTFWYTDSMYPCQDFLFLRALFPRWWFPVLWIGSQWCLFLDSDFFELCTDPTKMLNLMNGASVSGRTLASDLLLKQLWSFFKVKERKVFNWTNRLTILTLILLGNTEMYLTWQFGQFGHLTIPTNQLSYNKH